MPPNLWNWMFFSGSIMGIAGLACSIIWVTTRSNIAATASALGRALGASETRAPMPAGSFVTTASARMRVGDDAFLLRVERRHHGDDAAQEAMAALEDCVQRLVDAGLDPEDVVSEGVEKADGGGVTAIACVLVRGEEAGKRLSQAALASGFREERGRRRETFSLEDARDLLGRRAVERANANARTLRRALGMAVDFDLVGAELETEADDEAGGTVTMKARSVWQPGPVAGESTRAA